MKTYTKDIEYQSFWVPVVTLAILIMFIPFRIEHDTLNITKFIFLSVVGFVMTMRWINSVSKNHAKFFDYLLTPIILVVSISTLTPIGIIAVVVGVILPRSLTLVGWLVSAIVIFTLGVRIKQEGEMPSRKEILMFIANHSSFLDYFLIIFMMGPFRKYKIVYGTNLHKYPILRFFLKRKGIGVDRKDMESKIDANEKIRQALKDGFSIAIFPEGTRMRSHQMDVKLLPFTNGAFRSANESGVSIVPIVFDWPILYSAPDKPWLLSPHKIKVTILPTIDTLGEDTRIIKDRVHKNMKNTLG